MELIMGCRECFDLFDKYGLMNFKSRNWKNIPWKLVFADTAWPLVCKVVGHKWVHDKMENYTYCTRCGRLKD